MLHTHTVMNLTALSKMLYKLIHSSHILCKQIGIHKCIIVGLPLLSRCVVVFCSCDSFEGVLYAGEHFVQCDT